jgi:diadenosine tetraphosphate (Ap4A) HIT family hydrolase
MAAGSCPFCDLEGLRAGAVIYLANELCVFGNSETLEGDFLRGSGVIVPRSHRPTVFDLTPEEVAATFELLSDARPLLDRRYRPDGFNIGWNCYAAGGQATDHAHMHVLLRFADEPKSGQGIRWPLRQPDNVRPDPTAAGQGKRDLAV